MLLKAFLFLALFTSSAIAQSFSTPNEHSTHEMMMPEGVLKLAPDEKFLIWVELADGRLNLLEQQEDGSLEVVKVVSISIGKKGYGKEREGDKRTPVGVYHFTSFLTDSALVDFYGLGAYPLNYPNALDRRLKKTGSGIWLHGLPKGVEERPFLDSDGCVVIDNSTIQDLASYIDTGMTHIVLTEKAINWLPVQTFEKERESLGTAFDEWRTSWEAIDNEQYLSFYGESFDDFRRNKNEWGAYKTRINNNKSSIKVNVSKLSFFSNPNAKDIVSVRYYQEYESSNYDWAGWKEQLWQKENDQWKIIYEGNG